MKKIKKIILAYSGGLDTSVILKWLKKSYSAEIIAYVANIGQEEELENLKEKAIKTGASKIYIENLQEDFVKNYVFKAIQANAIYEGKYLLGTSLSRPLIAKRQIEIAHKENADAVAHGSTGKGNDQVRFELTFKALDPSIKIIAPWREWKFKSREELIQYARLHEIDIPVTLSKPYSCDRNIAHLSFEGGILEDPNQEANENTFFLSNNPEKAPNKAEYIELSFEEGIPIAINKNNLSEVDLMNQLNKIAGLHGIGRIDIVENRLVGMKSRGVYEAPGVSVLMEAHKALESITIERDTFHYKEFISLKYAELIYNGLYFHPLKEALDAFIKSTQKTVSGQVKLKLYKGMIYIIGRKSKYSLYNKSLSTFEQDKIYNQKNATGFINLFSLNLIEASKQKIKLKNK